MRKKRSKERERERERESEARQEQERIREALKFQTQKLNTPQFVRLIQQAAWGVWWPIPQHFMRFHTNPFNLAWWSQNTKLFISFTLRAVCHLLPMFAYFCPILAHHLLSWHCHEKQQLAPGHLWLGGNCPSLGSCHASCRTVRASLWRQKSRPSKQQWLHHDRWWQCDLWVSVCFIYECLSDIVRFHLLLMFHGKKQE